MLRPVTLKDFAVEDSLDKGKLLLSKVGCGRDVEDTKGRVFSKLPCNTVSNVTRLAVVTGKQE
jgi:hypothetical protein